MLSSTIQDIVDSSIDLGEGPKPNAASESGCVSPPSRVPEPGRAGTPEPSSGKVSNIDDSSNRGPHLDPGLLPVQRVGEELCRLAGQIAAATSRFLRFLADFDARKGWAGVNIASCAHWLNWKCGLDLRTAREHVRVARALTELPRIQAAFDAGKVSYSKVRAISRVATETSEADLLDAALHSPASYVERLARGLRYVQKETPDDPEGLGLKPRPKPAPAKEVAWHWHHESGDLVIKGRLSAADGARLLAAASRATYELNRCDDESDSEKSPKETRTCSDGFTEPPGADESESERSAPEAALTTRPPSDLGPALVAMADMVCAHLSAPAHAPAADVMVTVDIDTLTEAFAEAEPEAMQTRSSESGSAGNAHGDGQPGFATDADLDHGADSNAVRVPGSGPKPDPTPSRGPRATVRGAHLDDGPALTATCLRQLVEDGRLRFAVTDPQGRTLDIGRASRNPNAAQFRALFRRDHGCSMPGCGRTRFLQAHHVVFWSNGGATSLDNLVLLCRDHHRRLHEREFSIVALGGQQFRFVGPDGITISPAPALHGNADELVQEYLDIEPETIQPDWDGTPLHRRAFSDYLSRWKATLLGERGKDGREQARDGSERSDYSKAC